MLADNTVVKTEFSSFWADLHVKFDKLHKYLEGKS